MNQKFYKFLRNSLSVLILCIWSASSSYAQALSGTKTIDPSGSGANNYLTLKAAIDSLNLHGVGTGGVTFNVAASFTETAPAGGYAIAATGSSGNSIVFNGNAAVLTASAALTAGALNDAIIKIVGADYITVSGFVLNENAANTVTAAATNTMTEWGIAVLYASATNGAKHVTIQNNTIALNRTYQNTFGIYASSRHTDAAPTTTADISSAGGAHDTLTIHANQISNVNNGISIIGSSSAANMARGLDIGGGSLATGNTITNYGTTGTFSAYPSVAASVNGIYVNNNVGINVSNNTVTSSVGGTTAGILRGIYVRGSGTLPTSGSHTNVIIGNTISVQSASATEDLMGILNEVGNANISVVINGNNFNNTTHTAASSGVVTLLANTGAALNTTISGNTFTNLSINTSGSVTIIENTSSRPANGSNTVTANSIVTAFAKTTAGGTLRFYNSNGSSPTTANEVNSGNNFSNISVTSATTVAGWVSTDGATSSPFGPTKTVTGNTFNNITGGSSAVTILNVANSNAGGTNMVAGNTITNINSAGNVTAITSGGGVQSILSNTINTIASTGGNVTGMTLSGGTQSASGNTINTLSTTGANTVTGITNSGGANLIFKNKIYDLTANNAGASVNGMTISGSSLTSVNVYNNLIGDLKAPISSSTAPADAIRGINITASAATSNIFIYYNSIYINATSTGANFSTAGIFHTFNSTATTAALTLRNNIIVNTSTAAGTGLTVALKRSSSTNLNNYTEASNNNLLYAGTPGVANLIYYDGTNSDQTITDFKTRVGTSREAFSVTENPAWLSTTGSASDFLKPNTALTQIESGALTILTPAVTEDFGGSVRAGSPGYPVQTNGGGTAPDMGAWEIDAIPANPSITNLLLTPGVACVAASHTVSVTVVPNQGTTSAVTLNYSFDGVAQTPIVMTNTTGNTWAGIIPAATPTNAVVTFNVSAINSVSAGSTVVMGTPYADEPLNGATLTASADITTVCLGKSVVLSAVMVPNNPAPTTYCSTSYTNGTGSGDFISKVKIFNTALDNSTGAAGSPYSTLYPATGSTTATLAKGSSYTLQVGGGTYGTCYISAWIDWNHNGVFETSEFIGVSPNVGASAIGNFANQIVVPANAVGGQTRMRLRSSDTGPGPSASESCNATNSGYGETEDYIISIPLSGLTYSWSDGSTTVGTTSTITVSPTTATNYTVTATEANSCSVTSSPLAINVINTTMTGPYTVGPGGNFTTLTSAVDAYNSVCNLSGPVEFLLTDTLYSTATGEVFPIVINGNASASATNKLTIKPSAGVSSVIRGNSAVAIIKLNGADYVTIDGSNAGTNSRDLSIENTNTGTTAAIVWLNSFVSAAKDSATNNTIQNCNILGNSGTTTFVGIASSGAALGAVAEAANSNNKYINNRVRRASYGIAVVGPVTGDRNVLIEGNTFGATELAFQLGFRGMFVSNQDSFTVSNNTIAGINSNASNSTVGILLVGDSRNGNIFGNKVNDVKNTNSGVWQSYGIQLTSSNDASNVAVYNNFIQDVTSYGGGASTTYNGFGLYISDGGGYKVYYNTISLNVNQISTGLTSAVLVTSGVTAANSIDMRNNIFSNTQTTGTPYAIYSVAANTVFSNLDYNSYISAGTNLGFIAGSDRANIVAIQSAFSGANGHSQSTVPVFTSPTDLHLVPGTMTHLESGGIAISGYTTDIDGDVRPGPVGSINGGGTAPDLGADEFDGVPDLGDIVTPTFTLDSILPVLNSCLTSPRTFYVTASDASGIDSVVLFYQVGSSPMTFIMMTNTTGNQYTASLAPVLDSSILYSFRVVDASANHNAIDVAGGSFKDRSLTASAGNDVTIVTGTTATLNASTGASGAILFTDIVQCKGCSGETYPPYVSASDDDFIEITNIDAGSHDLSGYIVEVSGGYTATYTIPSGAIVPGGEVLLLGTAASPSASSPANRFYGMGATTTSSGVQMGFILKDPSGQIVDALATNGYVFPSSAGVSAAEWSGTIPGNGGLSGSYRVSGDSNNASDWANASPSANVTPGVFNAGLTRLLAVAYSWSGGLFSTPQAGNPVTTPVHNTPGVFTYTVTATSGSCTSTDMVDVTVITPVTPVADFKADTTKAYTGGKVTTVNFTDLSVNIPTQWEWTFTPNTVTFVGSTSNTSQNPKVEFNEPGLYTVKMKASNVAGADSMIKLDYINVVLGYCEPIYTNGAGSGDYISLAQLGVLNNATLNAPSPYYTNFADSTSIPVPQIAGGAKDTLRVSAGTFGTSFLAAWIDYNYNGVFEPSEKLGEVSPGAKPNIGVMPFIVPPNTPVGFTRMRIREGDDTNVFDACLTADYGETEDYAIEILPTPPMVYQATEVVQDTVPVLPGAIGVNVIAVKVITSGAATPLTAERIKLSTAGTTNVADVTSVKVYYTGNSNVFSTTTLFGTGTAAATVGINGSQVLSTDTNYFWVTYDVSASATIGNFLDAACDSVTITGTRYAPASPAPFGNKPINIQAPVLAMTSDQPYNAYPVAAGSNNNGIIRVKITMGSGVASVATRIRFNGNGTSDINDIPNSRLWYTGANPDFSQNNQFGGNEVPATGTFEFNGSQALLLGDNYFWLTYDIAATATASNVIDASVVDAIIAGNTSTATVSSPAGVRTIMAFPYCEDSADSEFDEDIGQVIVGAFTNTTGGPTPINNNPASVHRYNNFTGLLGMEAQKMTPQNISVSIINSGSNTYNTTVNAFIDYDHNGVFDVPGERVFKAYVPGGAANRTLTGTFTAPITAMTGYTAIRIVASETQVPNNELPPCEVYDWGETEDYLINILAPPPGDYYPPNITGITLSPDSQCLAVSHTITAQIFDTTGVDTAWVDYTVDGIAQPSIVMTLGTGTTYTGVIPPHGKGKVVFSVRAMDSSAVHVNTISVDGDTYQDQYFNVSAGNDKYIAINQTATLSANTSLDRNFRITEFTLYDFGTGAQPTWPPYVAEHDDNIEITNLSAAPADLSGFQLITEGSSISPQTFTFPAGTIVPAQGVAVVHFGFGTTSAANNYFATGTGSLASSGTSLGIVLKDATGNVNDAVATNSYDFSSSPNGVLAGDWTSVGVTSQGGFFGAGLYGADNNDTSNWISAGVGSAVGTMGYPNTGLPTLTSGSVLTWTGGLFTTPQAGASVTTPVHPALGSFDYYVTGSDGVCTTTDTITVHVITGPTVNLGPDGEVCLGGTRTLDAGNVGSTYAWTMSPSSAVISTDQTLVINAAGTYKVVVTNMAGLTGTDSIVVAAGPAYTVSLGADRTICTGGSALLDPGAGASSYLWSTGATTQTISVNTVGSYWVKVISATGCEAYDTVDVGLGGTPPVVNLGADLDICASDPALLDAGHPGATYTWSTGATTQTIMAGQAGTYWVVVDQPGGGCTGTDTIVITNKPAPVVNLGADQEICSGTSVVLNPGAQAGVTYLWSTTATTATITATTPGTYWVRVTSTANGCATTDTIVITDKPSPVVNLGANPNICPGDSVTLDAGNAGSTYLWSTGEITQTIKAKAATQYSVIVTGTNGCIGRDTVTVIHKTAPSAAFTSSISQANGLEVQFNVAPQGGVSYAWNFGDNTSSSQPNPKHLYAGAGTYTVTLTVTLISTGCKTTHDTIITVNVGLANNFAQIFRLSAAPNPFNERTSIKFELPQSSEVTLEIYDMIGKKVASLIENEYLSGKQEIDWNIENNNTGVYFVRLTVDGKTSILRVTNTR